jgi:hypothetical protein
VSVFFTVNDTVKSAPFVIRSLLPNETVTITFTKHANLSAPGTYIVESWTELQGDVDPSNNRAVKIVYRTSLSTLPWFEGFEELSVPRYLGANISALPGAPRCSLSSSDGAARFRSTALAFNGSQAATLDRSSYSADAVTLNLTCTLDLVSFVASQSNVRLSFAFLASGSTPHPNNRLWVRSDANSSWLEVLDFDQQPVTVGSWRTFDLGLSQALAAAQRQFSRTFEIRFGFGGYDSCKETQPWQKAGAT